MKKFYLLFALLFSFTLIAEELMNIVPEASDYAVEFDLSKALKVKKFAELANANPFYISFKAVFQSKGLDFEKSINKVLIAGSYGKKASLILDTKLTEKDFVSLINDKKPQTFNISSRKIYKYNDNNKIIFASYLKNGKIIFSENPSVVTEFKTVDFEKIIQASYPVSNQLIGRGYFHQFEKALKPKRKKENQQNSLLNSGIKEGYFEISSADGIFLDNIIYLPLSQENQKLLEFQVNTLLILFTAKIAQGNQKLANQIRDGFKMSIQGNICKILLKLDSSLLDTEFKNGKNTKEDFFDPFTE